MFRNPEHGAEILKRLYGTETGTAKMLKIYDIIENAYSWKWNQEGMNYIAERQLLMKEFDNTPAREIKKAIEQYNEKLDKLQTRHKKTLESYRADLQDIITEYSLALAALGIISKEEIDEVNIELAVKGFNAQVEKTEEEAKRNEKLAAELLKKETQAENPILEFIKQTKKKQEGENGEKA